MEYSPSIETPESDQEVINSEFNLLLREVRKVNEGAAGIIIKLDPKQFSERLQSALSNRGVDINESAAGKLLKIYNQESARNEYDMQTKAYDVVESASVDVSKTSMIPAPIYFNDINIDQETQDNLRAQGIQFGAENKVSLILMEWIPGEDLCTKMYKKVLSYYPEHPAYPDNIDDFQQLEFAVSIILGFAKPNTEASTPEEQAYDEALLYKRNFDKVYKFLDAKNLKFNLALVEQIKNAVNLLHKNKIWHNDLHERNTEVIGDIFDPEADIRSYILDFDKASIRQKEYGFNDNNLIDRLSVAIEADPNIEIETLKNSLLNNSNYNNVYDSIVHAVQTKNNPETGVIAAIALFDDEFGYKSIITTQRLIDQKVISSDDAKKYLNSFLQTTKDKRAVRIKNLKKFSENI
jgi:hypothetical protein